MNIYNRIPLLRAEKGMSRQQLAEMVDVNYQTIGFIERGDYYPSLELALKIARVFDVSVSVVFSDVPFEPIFRNEGETNE